MDPCTDGSSPLRNARREAFAQHYAGACFSHAADAYRSAGYAPKSAESAGPRLLSFVEVYARVQYLRRQAERQLGCDRLSLLRDWIAIKDDPGASAEVRAAVIGKLWQALGYEAPKRLDVRQSIKAQLSSGAPSPEQVEAARRRLEQIAAEVSAMPLPAEAFLPVGAEAPST